MADDIIQLMEITEFHYSEKTAVVCHDAGGANVIIAGLLKSGRSDWQAYMAGPAKVVWEKAFPNIQLHESIESALDGASMLISGTGWATDIEHDARVMALEKGLFSISLIEHWANYPNRFVRNKETVWPDIFWLTDDEAIEEAKKFFPIGKLRRLRNYYSEDQVNDIVSKQVSSPLPEVLFTLEPIRDHWGKDTAGEFQALDYFVSKLPELSFPEGTTICLRLHPSEEKGKYDDWIEANKALNITLDDSPSLSDAVARASWVVGCNSAAMAISVLAGKTVYCALPPWTKDCVLPHDKIIKLKNL